MGILAMSEALYTTIWFVLIWFVFFPALEGPSRIEHAAKQPLLPLNGLPLEAIGFEPAGELGRLVRHVSGTGDVPLPAELLELLCQGPLLCGQALELLAKRSSTSHWQQTRALLAEAALLLRQLSQSLEGFCQA